MARIINWRYSALLPVLIAFLILPLIANSTYYFRVGSLVWIMALAAVGLHILMGLAGQVSLGHAGFFGIGAYAVAVLPAQFCVSPLLSSAIGILAAGLLAYVVGRPILRLRGHYLAVATLGFGLLVALVITSEIHVTGGPDGVNVARLRLNGHPVTGAGTWYWITGVALLLGMAAAVQLRASPTGRALCGLQDSEVASAAMGIDVSARKLQAFVIGAIYAAIAGSLLALMNGFVTPDVASFLNSIEFVAMIVIGGMATPLGAVVGAAILVILPQVMAVYHDYHDITLGLIIMLFMIFLRQGIAPSLAALAMRRA
jgi:branched-chain amino acid transport system permease protein